MRRKLPAGMAIMLLAVAASCGRNGGKPPAVLQATPEAIALIRDNEARCAKIGQDGVQRLTTAEGELELNFRSYSTSRTKTAAETSFPTEEPKPPLQPSDVFKRYLAEDAAEELAAADTAQRAIQDLLPQVKAEAPPDLAGAVEALSGAHDQVCLAVRQPRRSAQYRGTLDFAENGYRAAEEKLRPLYTVSATDTQFALHKYGTSLEEARIASRRRNRPEVRPVKDYDRDKQEWKAVQQVQSQTEVEHEAALNNWYRKRDKPQESMPKLGVVEKAPLSPEEQAQAMKAWHSGYTAKVEAVKAALSNYLRLRNPGAADPAARLAACQTLQKTDATLLADASALEPPDAAVAKPLRAAFTHLQALAEACQIGQNAETAFQLDGFERSLAQAATALHSYSLAP
ncbi:MAG TPA: hypothetical protein VLV54_03035 [Thermoanaerobaculia bacterium]|nr:hypothetical protein [Thermoanaerobaculia bacterium]